MIVILLKTNLIINWIGCVLFSQCNHHLFEMGTVVCGVDFLCNNAVL